MTRVGSCVCRGAQATLSALKVLSRKHSMAISERVQAVRTQLLQDSLLYRTIELFLACSPAPGGPKVENVIRVRVACACWPLRVANWLGVVR